MKTSFTPLYDKVLIRPKPQETISAGGIVIPENSKKERPTEGTVIAVGHGRLTPNDTVLALKVKPGDKVIYSKYGGSEIQVDGETMIVLAESDILGIVGEVDG